MTRSTVFRAVLNYSRRPAYNGPGITSGFSNIHRRKLHAANIPVKEIQIPVQWGHIAAKLWGNEQERPVLALHGWQDNAGTWDPIAPLLYKNQPILAIDLPGHGLSSWIPPGMHYYAWDLPRLILHIKNYFKWDKISFLSHSMGSIASCRFTCLYPDDVDYYIAIDSLIYDDYDLNMIVGRLSKILQKIEIAQTRLNEEPPSYPLEVIIDKWHSGTRKSIAKESVPHLVKRGTKSSRSDPSKYYFSRDPRLKSILFNPESKKFVETLVLKMKSPTLYIKGIDSPYSSDNFSVEMRELIEKNNENFVCQFLPGTHHLHLNDPNRVASAIILFLKKYNFWKI